MRRSSIGILAALSRAARVAAFALFALPTRAETIRTLRVELAGDEVSHFAVENLAGTMRIVPGNERSVVAIATVHAEDARKAESLRFERVAGEQGAATVRVRYPEGLRTIRYRGPSDQGEDWFLDFGLSGNRYDYDGHTYRVRRSHGAGTWADVEVRVPARTIGARFENLVGLVEAEQIQGRLRFEVRSADLKLHRLSGELDLDGTSGDTRAREIRGTWKSHFSSGDLDLEGFDGDSLTLHTSSGDIVARGVRAGRVAVETSSGDVSLRESDIEELVAHASSGDISLDSNGARLRNVRAHTSSGNVTLRLPRDASFEADADQSSGDMEVAFSDGSPVRRHERLVGFRRGSGGARIFVETSSGDLTLEPR